MPYTYSNTMQTQYVQIGKAKRDEVRHKREYLRRENKKWPETLQEIPEWKWPPKQPAFRSAEMRVRVLRSRTFLVQVFDENGTLRLTVCRTSIDDDGGYEDGITWDELQRLKNEAGYADKCAVELYPPDGQVVNVANMRHLWILDEPPPFIWKKSLPSGRDGAE